MPTRERGARRVERRKFVRPLLLVVSGHELASGESVAFAARLERIQYRKGDQRRGKKLGRSSLVKPAMTLCQPVEEQRSRRTVAECARDCQAGLAVLSRLFSDVENLAAAASYDCKPETVSGIEAAFLKNPTFIPVAAHDVGARSMLKDFAVCALPAKRRELAAQIRTVAKSVKDGEIVAFRQVEKFIEENPGHNLPANIIDTIESTVRTLR